MEKIKLLWEKAKWYEKMAALSFVLIISVVGISKISFSSSVTSQTVGATNTVSASAPTQTPAPPPKQAVTEPKQNYQQGVTYTYYSDGSCKPTQNIICLSRDEYIAICKVAKGVTNGAVKTRAVMANRDEKALLEGGNFETVRVLWAESNSGKSHCYAIATVSGIVDGTSKRLDIQGIASQFILSDKNNVLVSYFNLM